MATIAGHWFMMFVFILAQLNVQVHGTVTVASLTILDSAVSKGAVCLDGTPPAFFHEKGFGSGADNWIVYLEGGGWCIDEHDCINRITGAWSWYLGTSNNISSTNFNGILTNQSNINPDFYNWNRVFIHYCDGGSFSGDVKEVNPATNITRRGARIFKAVVEHLLEERGMKHAKNAMLAGNSAGGLATMLQCDHFRRLVPRCVNVKCVADSGFFIHGKNLSAPERREHPFASTVAYHGLDKFLHKSCTSKMDAGLCFFPENFVEYIKTPLFIVNSAFDQFQLDYRVEPVEPGWADCVHTIKNISQPCTPPQVQAINDFHTAFLQALPKSICPSRGLWINNCFNHDHMDFDDRWNGTPKVNNKTAQQVVGEWFFNQNCANDIESGDFPYYCIKRWQ